MRKLGPKPPRIVGGAWRGTILQAPPGSATRPTAARLRQALFDMLMHAPWAGRRLLDEATVLDAFAGTGAFGLEALSRGASHAVFVERDRAARLALSANIAACAADRHATIIAGDALHPPAGRIQSVVFLDPPYGAGLVMPALLALTKAGWVDSATIIIAETSRNEVISPDGEVLARRLHGAAQLVVWRDPTA